ncbi:hypothetical protein AVEN_126247-1 [Araneus ventricosus]|uniref:Uncharacterized protein n=1 Tax=Araneus ventricosus TaxID=182803 RepID=A0A4Y2L3F2_ARAVE|nr:hypothetical protein AVEN_126247-1 [Araneus ventricosus]
MPDVQDKPIPLTTQNLPGTSTAEKKRSGSGGSEDLPLGYPSPAPTPEPAFHRRLLVCGLVTFVVLPLAGAAIYFVIESLKKSNGQHIDHIKPVDKPFDTFFVIKRTTSNESSHTVSPFLVERAVTAHLGITKSTRKLRSGNLLIEVATRKQAEQIVKLKSLDNISVARRQVLQSLESDADAEMSSSSASEGDTLEYDMSEDLEDTPQNICPTTLPPPSTARKR